MSGVVRERVLAPRPAVYQDYRVRPLLHTFHRFFSENDGSGSEMIVGCNTEQERKTARASVQNSVTGFSAVTGIVRELSETGSFTAV